MLGGLLHQRVAVDGIDGVDEFFGRERGTTLLTLVAVGSFGMATWAFTLDVAVGQELLCFLVIELFRGDFHKLALVVEFPEEVGGKLVVRLAGGAAVDVETDAEVGKRLLDDAMIAVHHVLHGASLFLRTDGHGHTVFIASTHKQHLATLQAQVSCIDVGRHIHASQVADVHRPIGIRQSRRHRCSLVVLLFHVDD